MDKNLSFLFTPDGFRPDVSEGEENAVWMEDGGFPVLTRSGPFPALLQERVEDGQQVGL